MLLAVVPSAHVFGQPFWINVGTRIVIFSLAAASLDLIVGYGGLISFGHAAFFAIGGYAAALLANAGIDSAPLLLSAATIAGALAGLAIGSLSLRTSGIYFIMITLAFAQMVFFGLIATKAIGGNDGLSMAARATLPLLDLRDPATFYVLTVALLIGFIALKARLVASPFGFVLNAARQSERRVRSLGVSVFRYRLAAFCVAAAGAGLAGGLWAEFARFVSPDMASWPRSGDFLIMLILGGIGTTAGAVFGSAVLLGLESLLSGWTEHWMLWLGIILLVFVVFAKRGVSGLLRRNADG